MSTREIAYSAARAIKEYWRTHPEQHMFEKVEVNVHPGTFEIKSNMINGYPPLRVMDRSL